MNKQMLETATATKAALTSFLDVAMKDMIAAVPDSHVTLEDIVAVTNQSAHNAINQTVEAALLELGGDMAAAYNLAMLTVTAAALMILTSVIKTMEAEIREMTNENQ